MNCHITDISNTCFAGVLSRVLHPGLLDQEEGGGDRPLVSDLADAAPDGGVGDGLLIMIPEDVLRRLWAATNQNKH